MLTVNGQRTGSAPCVTLVNAGLEVLGVKHEDRIFVACPNAVDGRNVLNRNLLERHVIIVGREVASDVVVLSTCDVDETFLNVFVREDLVTTAFGSISLQRLYGALEVDGTIGLPHLAGQVIVGEAVVCSEVMLPVRVRCRGKTTRTSGKATDVTTEMTLLTSRSQLQPVLQPVRSRSVGSRGRFTQPCEFHMFGQTEHTVSFTGFQQVKNLVAQGFRIACIEHFLTIVVSEVVRGVPPRYADTLKIVLNVQGIILVSAGVLRAFGLRNHQLVLQGLRSGLTA